MFKKLSLLLAICAVLSYLSGCSSTATSEADHSSLVTTSDPDAIAQALQLERAQILAQQGQFQQSLELALNLDPQPLTELARWQLLLLIVENNLALELGRPALQAINQQLETLDSLTREQYFLLEGLRAQAFTLTGHYEVAVRHYFNQTQQATTGEQLQQAEDNLWNTLNQLSGEVLQLLAAQEQHNLLQGWFELAALRQQVTENFDLFEQGIADWKARWPQHPAAQQLPKDLQLLAELSQNRIQHIGVFLPTSGPLASSANAIRNALVARHLYTQQQGIFTPQLSFYDTQAASLDDLYKQAQADQVDVVLGPLAKSRVDLLERRSHLPLPTLALNYGNDEQFPNTSLYQFGLSAENEAQQAAIKAWQSGFRTALTLTPESDWGSRVEQSFIQAWKELGGQLAHNRQYGESTDLDTALRQLLEVQLSQQRHQRLIRLLGQRPHFIARPREDADFLFLHASTATARQVKPALSFLMAADLPVLATSSVYAGTPNPSQDRDMNGIAFCDISWYLNPEDELQSIIRQTWPNSMNRYGRLYAMGVDAYLLAQRLELLDHLPASRIDGATGRLSQNNRRIVRELQWAQFIAGRPQPLAEQAFQQRQLIDQLELD